MDIKCFPLSSNCYVVSDDDKNTVVFDIGERGEEIYAYLADNGFNVTSVILTHAHFDHIMGLCDFMQSAKRDGKDVCVYIHSLDAKAMKSAEENLSVFATGKEFRYDGELTLVGDGEQIKVGNMTFDVIFCPGHTRGSACYVSRKEKTVFSGDVLFEGSVGRCDFPGGSAEMMKESLSKLMTLPDSYRVYPGHGNSTTIGDERKFNPFVASI